jgi:hypothetical protein
MLVELDLDLPWRACQFPAATSTWNNRSHDEARLCNRLFVGSRHRCCG